jgi:ATP-dependent DNA helicase PIF1
MDLSKGQKTALLKYKKGENIFITGSGGSGKSEIIKIIFNDATLKRKRIQVCAMTGCAAILLKCDARTLHSWSGIGLGNKPLEEITYRIGSNPRAKQRWCHTQILVIDEVSMMSVKLFNLINNVAKIIRKNDNPFGGMQVILSGDFYQLPPIGDKNCIETKQYCFESDEWYNAFNLNNHIELKTIFRQNDNTLTNILNKVRCGEIDDETINILEKKLNRPINESLLRTKLFPTRYKVEQINQQEFNKLSGEKHIYKMKRFTNNSTLSRREQDKLNSMTEDEIEREFLYLEGNLMCKNTLELKIGTQVMCIINVSNPDTDTIVLSNGSQGKVIGFDSCTDLDGVNTYYYPIVLFNNGYKTIINYHSWDCERVPRSGVSQLPLIHSWAMTIHKSQGLTIDNVELDIGNNIFEYGQTYVALSRIKTFDGLYLLHFDYTKIKFNQTVKDFYRNIDESNNESNTKMY